MGGLLDYSKKIEKRRIYSKDEFCAFVLWSVDCNLASSFSNKAVLLGNTEHLAQRIKITLRINPSLEVICIIRTQTSRQPYRFGSTNSYLFCKAFVTKAAISSTFHAGCVDAEILLPLSQIP